ncbi:hypothetical protein CEXT_121121, partial [Caerostris extrusa]
MWMRFDDIGRKLKLGKLDHKNKTSSMFEELALNTQLCGCALMTSEKKKIRINLILKSSEGRELREKHQQISQEFLAECWNTGCSLPESHNPIHIINLNLDTSQNDAIVDKPKSEITTELDQEELKSSQTILHQSKLTKTADDIDQEELISQLNTLTITNGDTDILHEVNINEKRNILPEEDKTNENESYSLINNKFLNDCSKILVKVKCDNKDINKFLQDSSDSDDDNDDDQDKILRERYPHRSTKHKTIKEVQNQPISRRKVKTKHGISDSNCNRSSIAQPPLLTQNDWQDESNNFLSITNDSATITDRNNTASLPLNTFGSLSLENICTIYPQSNSSYPIFETNIQDFADIATNKSFGTSPSSTSYSPTVDTDLFPTDPLFDAVVPTSGKFNKASSLFLKSNQNICDVSSKKKL